MVSVVVAKNDLLVKLLTALKAGRLELCSRMCHARASSWYGSMTQVLLGCGSANDDGAARYCHT